MDDKPGEGWAYLPNARKWHYFDNSGWSLCRKWLFLGRDREQGNNSSPDNCEACRKKILTNIVPVKDGG